MTDKLIEAENDVVEVETEEFDFKKVNAKYIEGLSDAERFEVLQKELDATSKMDIDGNKYTKVAVRVNLFRKYFSLDYSLSTDRLSSGDTEAVFKTTIRNLSNDKIVATGHSRKANHQDGNIPGFEFAETASIGRALSSFGIIGGEFASLEEVGFQAKDVANKATISVIIDLAKESGEKIENIEASLKHRNISFILKDEALDVMTKLNIMVKAKLGQKELTSKKTSGKVTSKNTKAKDGDEVDVTNQEQDKITLL